MGFSTVGSFIMLFFIVVIMISSIVFIYGTFIKTTNDSLYDKSSMMSNMLKTSISIKNASYGAAKKEINITVLNEGKTKLNTDYVDVFIDNVKIPRNSTNRTISFASNSTTINPLIWDPKETLIITVYEQIKKGTHIVEVSTEYGVTDIYTFVY